MPLAVRWCALLACAVFAGGCAGMPAGPALTVASPRGDASHSIAPATLRVPVSFIIRVPQRAGSRGARYVSPSTKSLAITVEPGTAQAVMVARDIAPGTSTVNVSLTPGSFVFNVQTFDGPVKHGTATGRLLSADDGFPFTIVRGHRNAIALTLQGVPAAVSLVSTRAQDVAGDQFGGFDFAGTYEADGTTKFARVFTAFSTDADGNYIVGPGAPKIALSTSNASVVAVKSSAQQPNTFTLVPAGLGPFPEIATIGVAAHPNAASGAAIVSSRVTVRITALNAPRVYAVRGSKIVVYDENGKTIALPGSPFTTLVAPFSIGADAHDGDLYAYDTNDQLLSRFDANGVFLGSTSVSPAAGAIAYDQGAGYLYVTLEPSSTGVAVFTEALNPVPVSGSWQAQCGSVPALPGVIIPDPHNGELYVLNESASCPVIQGYSTQGVATSDAWGVDSGGFQGAGVAQDPASGYLYFIHATAAVQVYDESGTPVAVSGSFPGLQEAVTDAWDPIDSTLYVYDSATGKISAFDGEGNAKKLAGSFSGSGTVPSMAILP